MKRQKKRGTTLALNTGHVSGWHSFVLKMKSGTNNSLMQLLAVGAWEYMPADH